MARIVLFFCSCFFLVSCWTSPEEALIEQLEKAAQLEGNFSMEQKRLLAAEEKDAMIFQQLISTSLDRREQIDMLTNEALQTVELKRESLEIEKASLEAGYKQLQQSERLLKKLNHEKLKQLVEELFQKNEKRYETYEQLFKHYERSIELDRQLYVMLANDHVAMLEIEATIHQINDSYEQVEKYKKSFNEYTRQLNELKHRFREQTRGEKW